MTLKVGSELERNPQPWRPTGHGGFIEREKTRERERPIITDEDEESYHCDGGDERL